VEHIYIVCVCLVYICVWVGGYRVKGVEGGEKEREGGRGLLYVGFQFWIG
jgi:hypothetical protein